MSRKREIHHTQHFDGYLCGVVDAMHFMIACHDQPTTAAEMRQSLCAGIPLQDLREMAGELGLRFPRGFWKEQKGEAR